MDLLPRTIGDGVYEPSLVGPGGSSVVPPRDSGRPEEHGTLDPTGPRLGVETVNERVIPGPYP